MNEQEYLKSFDGGIGKTNNAIQAAVDGLKSGMQEKVILAILTTAGFSELKAHVIIRWAKLKYNQSKTEK